MTRFVHLISTLALAFLATVLWVKPASAHAAPHSTVLLDLHAHDVGAELHLPIIELEVALHRSLLPEESRIVAQEAEAVRAYVGEYLHAASKDGSPWSVQVGDLRYQIEDAMPFLVVQTTLTPPSDASPRSFVLDYDVIAHDVVNHTAMVAVRNDFESGAVSGSPTVIGVIRYLRKSLVVDRTYERASAWRGVSGVFQLGVQHIAEGTDHLLFLLTLLLPASLMVRGKRWGAPQGARLSIRTILRVVTAFTIGHSITLLLGALDLVRLPSQPIEVLIAVSIFVSALHALRPIFTGREAWIAGGFGLVHGMAFANALTELHLDPYRLALAVFAFNLGIEAMQLLVIAMSLPWLMLLARTPAYRFVRLGGALFSASAALGWIAERALHVQNPMNAAVNALATRALAIVAILAGLAVVATLWSWLTAPRARSFASG